MFAVAEDLKLGFRKIYKNIKLSVVVILSLGIGIGANSAVFSLAEAILFKSLPVVHPEQLLILHWVSKDTPSREIAISMSGRVDHDNAGRLTMSAFSYPFFKALREQNDVLSGALAFAPAHATVIFDGRVELAAGELVSGSYFSELGVRPLAGRLLVESDANADSARVLVISSNYWVREFGRSPSAVGKVINIDKVPYTIAGIAPAGFHGIQTGQVPDFWLPLTEAPDAEVSGIQFPRGQSLSNSPGMWWLQTIVRAKPGVSAEQVTNELERVYIQHLLSAAGASLKAENLPRISVSSGARGLETLRQRLAVPLRLLAVGMVLVLLAACFNVAVLLLARSTARGREIGVRLALGASRQRVISQLMNETISLTVMGGLLELLSVTGLPISFFFSSPRDKRRLTWKCISVRQP